MTAHVHQHLQFRVHTLFTLACCTTFADCAEQVCYAKFTRPSLPARVWHPDYRKACTAQDLVTIWQKYVYPSVNQSTGKYAVSSKDKQRTSLSRTFDASVGTKDTSLPNRKRSQPSTPTMVLPKKAKRNVSADESDETIDKNYSGECILLV